MMRLEIIRQYFQGRYEEKISISSLGLHPEMLEILADLGVIEIREGAIEVAHLQRVHKMMRLRNLGVNVPGAAIILDLLDRIDELQAEIERLKEAR